MYSFSPNINTITLVYFLFLKDTIEPPSKQRGVAGTGQSHTIAEKSHAIPNEVMRSVFTAKAAFIVRGGTLNSMFQIPSDSKLQSLR